eukprot:CAMPEP_0206487072 /NCGR_PEP_ID=MMETSP0324_2-20121206/41397_1 /ASSEMBLY_ACC=CAM_ASM_000836 /TAXON_ID=2866 /ORGANISM="Crypthecodinium cohnii, Strain Seligo" /LENGTH=543 /DNA_ID=CAMNT_0053965431 /DNA_START=48 /DNA_END=1680 /DNA_ORIENTATION=+
MLPIQKGDLVGCYDKGTLLEDRFSVIQRLGSGAFGIVDLVRERQSNARRVCKTVTTKGFKLDAVAMMKKEIRLLQELDHPRIVRLFGYSEDPSSGKLRLILEYLAGGSLDTLLQGDELPCETLVARLMEQTLSATSYCHSRGIVHCDLKPENIIMTEVPQAVGAATYHVAVDVFGADGVNLSIARSSTLDSLRAFSSVEPESIRHMAGTAAFIAPEVLSVKTGGAYGPKADLWAIGMITYLLLTGRLPFGPIADLDAVTVFRKVRAFEGLGAVAAKQELSADAYDFLTSLLVPEPRKRLSAADALKAKWFRRRPSVHYKKIRRSTLRSLQEYAASPELVRVCLFLIAAKAEGKSDRRAQQAFMRLDTTGHGTISKEDLRNAIASPGGWFPGCCYPTVDVDELLNSINLSQIGCLQYTEFAAALLHAELGGKKGRQLAGLAFAAVDEDGDGVVTVDQLQAFFGAKRKGQTPFLSMFPPNKSLDELEFYKCLRPPKQSPFAYLCSPFWRRCYPEKTDLPGPDYLNESSSYSCDSPSISSSADDIE